MPAAAPSAAGAGTSAMPGVLPNLPGAMPAPHARTMKEDMELAKAAADHYHHPVSPPYSATPVQSQVAPPAAAPVPPQAASLAAPAPTPFIPPVIPQTPPASIVPSTIAPISQPMPQQNTAARPFPAPFPTPSTAAPAQASPMPPQNQANRDALHAVLKEYGIDPYREPVE